MTAAEFRVAIAALGLTQGGAAELLGVCLRSVNGYAAGTHRILGPVELVLNVLVEDIQSGLRGQRQVSP